MQVDKELKKKLKIKMEEICSEAVQVTNYNNPHQQRILFRLQGIKILAKTAARGNEPEAVLVFLLKEAMFYLNHLKESSR